MKCLLISAHQLPQTGAHYRFDRLAEALAESYEELIWISPRREEWYLEKLREINPKLAILTCKLVSRSFVMPQLLLSTIFWMPTILRQKQKVDLIITFGETTLAAALAAKLILRCPLSIGIRSNYLGRRRILINHAVGFDKFLLRFKSKINLMVLKLVYGFSDQFLVQSEVARDELIKNWTISSQKIRVIYNDLPVHFVSNAPLVWSGTSVKKILFVGDESAIKGFDLLVDALKMIELKNIGIQEITAVGISAQHFLDFKKYLSEQGVVFDTYIQTDNVLNLMLDHDLLVAPSREDSFPNTVMEALALKMPVIGADVGGIESILHDRKFMFEAGKAVDLAKKLRCVNEGDYYKKLMENSLKQRSRFMSNWSEEYCQLLEENM